MNFKALVIITSLAILVSCGNKNKAPSVVVSPLQPSDASVFSKWRVLPDEDALHGIEELDYTGLELDVEFEDQNCNGSYGNAGVVNGVSEGAFKFTGTEQSGVLQFGHLKYVMATDPNCRSISKEGYEYNINGNIMRVCMVNYPYCADYQKID